MYLSCVLSNIFYLPCWLSVNNVHPFVFALVVLTSFVLSSFMTMLSSIFVRKKMFFLVEANLCSFYFLVYNFIAVGIGDPFTYRGGYGSH